MPSVANLKNRGFFFLSFVLRSHFFCLLIISAQVESFFLNVGNNQRFFSCRLSKTDLGVPENDVE